jgi:hypothetical protein
MESRIPRGLAPVAFVDDEDPVEEFAAYTAIG